MPIKLDFDDIPLRQSEIKRIINPLIGQNSVIIQQPRNVDRNSYIFAIRDSNLDANLKFSDWRVKTKFKNIELEYYELWHEEAESQGDFYLLKKYLHLYFIEELEAESKQFLALHSDPNEPEENCFDYEHKVGPHIHFVTAGFPVSKFHTSLFIGKFADVNSSVKSLDDAFEQAVSMIEEQIQRFAADVWKLG